MSTTIETTANMNRMYRSQRHFYDATRRYYLLGRDELIARLQPKIHDTVLELGCGTGRNLVTAATRYPSTRFYGVDVSTEMLTTAIESVSRAGLSSRVRLAHCDIAAQAPDRLFGVAQFDRIFMSYVLSMIRQWPAALDAAMSALAPRGELHIVDFGGQERLPDAVRAALRWWLRKFDVVPCDRLEQELQNRTRHANAALVVERPHRGYAQYAVVRRR